MANPKSRIEMQPYFHPRREHLIECWKHARRNRAVGMIALTFAAYSFLTTIRPVVDVKSLSFLVLPKLPLPWAVIIVLGAIAFIAIEGGYRLRQEEKNSNFSLTPLQAEIFYLLRDLRQLLKDAGPPPELQSTGFPMQKGANIQAWTELRMIEAHKWENAHMEWARKLIYDYQQQFAERIKNLMRSLGASTGWVVVSLEPYTKDIRPGDFKDLIGILLDFFVKLEKQKDEPQNKA